MEGVRIFNSAGDDVTDAMKKMLETVELEHQLRLAEKQRGEEVLKLRERLEKAETALSTLVSAIENETFRECTEYWNFSCDYWSVKAVYAAAEAGKSVLGSTKNAKALNIGDEQ